jgi:hypothetical protein
LKKKLKFQNFSVFSDLYFKTLSLLISNFKQFRAVKDIDTVLHAFYVVAKFLGKFETLSGKFQSDLLATLRTVNKEKRK